MNTTNLNNMNILCNSFSSNLNISSNNSKPRLSAYNALKFAASIQNEAEFNSTINKIISGIINDQDIMPSIMEDHKKDMQNSIKLINRKMTVEITILGSRAIDSGSSLCPRKALKSKKDNLMANTQLNTNLSLYNESRVAQSIGQTRLDNSLLNPICIHISNLVKQNKLSDALISIKSCAQHYRSQLNEDQHAFLYSYVMMFLIGQTRDEEARGIALDIEDTTTRMNVFSKIEEIISKRDMLQSQSMSFTEEQFNMIRVESINLFKQGDLQKALNFINAYMTRFNPEQKLKAYTPIVTLLVQDFQDDKAKNIALSIKDEMISKEIFDGVQNLINRRDTNNRIVSTNIVETEEQKASIKETTLMLLDLPESNELILDQVEAVMGEKNLTRSDKIEIIEFILDSVAPTRRAEIIGLVCPILGNGSDMQYIQSFLH